MNDNVTSVSLLERLQDRCDESAWQRFYDLYGPLIRYWLMRRGVNQQDAGDVGQEVMQLAFSQLPDYRHNGRVGALRAWLRQVVANRLKTFWRQQNRYSQRNDYTDLADQLADPRSQMSRVWNEEYHRTLCERLLLSTSPAKHNDTFASKTRPVAAIRIIRSFHQKSACLPVSRLSNSVV